MDMTVTKESRYAVGVFSEGEALRRAHRELVQQGFKESEICLMAPGTVVNASRAGQSSAGNTDCSLHELVAALAPSATHCAAGTVYASSGNLCNCLGYDLETHTQGMWLSDVLGLWISRRSAEYFEDRLGEGKILLWVPIGHHNHVRREHLACGILLDHASESVRVLDFALRN